MIFKRKKRELTDEEKRMNKLWDLYSTGELDDMDHKIYCLCDYDGGVNGEGHSGFFCYSADCLTDIISTLKEILPQGHCRNLMSAYESYETDNEDKVCNEADDYFYENEQEILDILQAFADGLTL